MQFSLKVKILLSIVTLTLSSLAVFSYLTFNSYKKDKLRKYNTQLEQMVADRTLELQNLMNIQNAMLNSLGQGFVIVNKDDNILPVYSKVATEMIEALPDAVVPNPFLGLKPEDSDSLRELYEMTFNQMLNFDDMVKFKKEWDFHK